MTHKDSNMADNNETVLKMARFVAIAHIAVGILLICSGVADAITTSLYLSSDDFWIFWSLDRRMGKLLFNTV